MTGLIPRTTAARAASLFAIVAGGYFLGYRLAADWFSAQDQHASFFPAAGVTLAALVLVPRRWWPVVLAAAASTELVLDLTHGTSLVASAGYVLANTSEPLLGALLLTTAVARVDLGRTRDLALFVLCAVLVAPVLGGAVAATTFVVVDGNSGWGRFAFEWWSGDGLGVLVVAGALLALRPLPWLPRRRAVEALVVGALAVGATALLFERGWFAFVYLPIVLLVVLAFRSGTAAVAVTSALVAFVAAALTAEADTFWSSVDVSPANRILYLQLGLGVIVATTLALAAEIAGRERIAAELVRSETERAAALELARLADSEQRARIHAESVGRSAALLAGTSSVREVADVAVSVMAGWGAAQATFHLLDGDHLDLLAAHGVDERRQSRNALVALGDDAPSPEAARLRAPVVVQTGDEFDRRYPGLAHLRREAPAETVAAFPVLVDRAARAVLTVRMPDGGWLTPDRGELLATLADQAAVALGRASLLEREREARARAELDEQQAVKLQHVAGALAAAETARDVAHVVVTELVHAVGGIAGSLFVAGEGGSVLRLVERCSVGDATAVPVADAVPAADAYRHTRPVLLRDAGARRDAYPLLREHGHEHEQASAWAYVPLFAGSRAIGVVVVAFGEPQPFDDRQRDILLGICDAIGQALHRADLYEAEQRARARAELLESHAARLAAAASIEDVARITVAALRQAGASAAWLQLVRDGVVEIVASAGVPQAALALFARYELDAETPPAEALRTGTVVEGSTRAEIDTRYPGTAAQRGTHAFESIVAFPLVGSLGRTLGVLTLTAAEERWLDDGRRQLVTGVAEQCALALERAALQGEADAAAAEAALLALLGERLERVTGLQERAVALARTLTSERVDLAVVFGPALDERFERSVLAEAARESAPAVDEAKASQLAAAALAAGGPVEERVGDLLLLATPLRARDRVLGVLATGVHAGGDLAPVSTTLALRVATRAALALDNALLYEQERTVSHSLQMGLLGNALEVPPATAVATAYRPGTAALEVGGDWYDAFALPDGRVALLVGDVVGHGLEAAVAMGQLRGAVRALAPLGPPREVVRWLDHFVDTLPEAAMATLAYAELDTDAGTITYACAGHPPPLLVPAVGTPRLLWEGRSAPLGSSLGHAREQADEVLEPGDVIVFYTDGLVERRADGLAAGLDRLVSAAERATNGPSGLVARILEAVLDGEPQDDDVCILAAQRLLSTARFVHSFTADAAEVARMRHALALWLEEVDLEASRRFDVVLAVAEAAANAAEHAYGFDGRGVVRVEAWLDDGTLQVAIRDHGVWRAPPPDSDRGRGRTIMRALMPEVSIDRRPHGTIVRMSTPTTGEV